MQFIIIAVISINLNKKRINMHAVILIGIQGSGKSTFYKEHFFNTHVRISLDLLKTRHREFVFLQTCYNTQMRFVVDNTNPTPYERARYIKESKEHKYKVSGFFFDTSLNDAVERNKFRKNNEFIPIKGIIATNKKLVKPEIIEGFDELYRVTIKDNRFLVD